MDKPLIFVSCGQWSESERRLGKDICDLIRTSTSYEPYFAQDQSGLDGLTAHILGALDRAAAFLGVMHHRGTFQNMEGVPVTRASVWIEQEIAIAAYLRQIAKRAIEIRLFIQNGIALEGVRQHLIANPIFFDANAEVLTALPSVLSDWKLQSISHSITDPRAKEILAWKEAGQVITVR